VTNGEHDSNDRHGAHNDGQNTANVDPSLSIDAAAKELGVSPRTVRRHIKDGTLKAFKRTTDRGFEWRVYPGQTLSSDVHNVGQAVSIVVDNVGPQPQGDADRTIVEIIPPAAERERLQEQHSQALAQLGQALEHARGDAQHWRAQALEAQERIRMLEAPQEPAQPAQPEPTPAEPRKRRWLQQIFNR
jgi:Helix-turn-helix domain